MHPDSCGEMVVWTNHLVTIRWQYVYSEKQIRHASLFGHYSRMLQTTRLPLEKKSVKLARQFLCGRWLVLEAVDRTGSAFIIGTDENVTQRELSLD